MILSPMQPGNVTKEEFKKFESYVEEGFEKSIGITGIVEKKVDVLKEDLVEFRSYVKDGFDGLGRQIDFVEKNLGIKIDLIAGDVSWLKRSMVKVMNNMTKVTDNMGKVMDKLGVSGK